MAYLAAWIQQLVLAVIIATFLDLLLPNNAMQRYVRLVMGLVILMLILSPLLTLFKSDWGADELFFGEQAAGDELESLPHIQNKTDDLLEKQEQLTADTVQARLEEGISEGVEKKFSLAVNEVSVTLSDRDPVGVAEVMVTVDPHTEIRDGEHIEPVKPVTIDLTGNRDDGRTERVFSTTASPLSKEIREWVSREWRVDKANVHVHIVEKGG